MPAYRIYFLEQGAHIRRPPVVVECDSDGEAINKAKPLVNGYDVEIWCGDARVAVLSTASKH